MTILLVGSVNGASTVAPVLTGSGWIASDPAQHPPRVQRARHLVEVRDFGTGVTTTDGHDIPPQDQRDDGAIDIGAECVLMNDAAAKIEVTLAGSFTQLMPDLDESWTKSA